MKQKIPKGPYKASEYRGKTAIETPRAHGKKALVLIESGSIIQNNLADLLVLAANSANEIYSNNLNGYKAIRTLPEIINAIEKVLDSERGNEVDWSELEEIMFELKTEV